MELAFVKNPKWKPQIGIQIEALVLNDVDECTEEVKSGSICSDEGCCGNDYICDRGHGDGAAVRVRG